MSTLELDKVAEGILPRKTAIKYLSLYVGESDWDKHINELYVRFQRKTQDPAGLMRKALACTILLPAVDRSTYIDAANPENLLYRCSSYRQFDERDWFQLLQKTIKEDQTYNDYRKRALMLGVIDPIQYQPYCREAFNKLFNNAEDSGALQRVSKEALTKTFKNVVWSYGGVIPCNIFNNHDKVLKTIVNWNSGYFFERAIYKVYDIDQILKIKGQELQKTNQSLIHMLKLH